MAGAVIQAPILRRVDIGDPSSRGPDPLLAREWLVTNGLGGYASATIAGIVTRRYHGLLVAALPTPLGRTIMLNHLTESVRLADRAVVRFGGEELAGGDLQAPGLAHLIDFRLEDGLPVWRFEVGTIVIEKRVLMPHAQNTTQVSWTLLEGDAVEVQLRPALHFRGYEAPVAAHARLEYALVRAADGFEIAGPDDRLPPLRLSVIAEDSGLHIAGEPLREVFYRVEQRRGYDAVGELWSPGWFHARLTRDAPVTLIASTEDWGTALALRPDQARGAERERRARLLDRAHADAQRDPVFAELTLAADPFIIRPWGRRDESIRASAAGDELRTIIAGYHWFTDWGRDTMISLEGLALCTGRWREAGYILRTFARHVRDGLIPNMFPDGSNEGLYHTADATLWLFHALDRYVAITGDRTTLRTLLPTMLDILRHHLDGTRFGIRVDPADGLLTQGAPGYQLTWMDAKVDDWVVTPRRGKAVEINALWYNALCVMERWASEAGMESRAWAEHAGRARESFNRRFPIPGRPWLFDVIDGEHGDDDACRPNQIFALSLPHPVLADEHWRPVLETVRQRLLTPVGLRSLEPGHPDYKPRYDGDLRARDAAYHQGTVWGWLIGPWIDAWLRVHPGDRAGAREFLRGLIDHMDDFGVGSLAEIYDAEPPFTPRGCIAQAWSVAETLRSWHRTS